MDKDLFYNWLKNFKKLDSTISNARTSNCLRIEKSNSGSLYYEIGQYKYYLETNNSILIQREY